MQVQTAAGTYALLYDSGHKSVAVWSNTEEAMELLLDGLELITGDKYVPESDTLVYVNREHIAQYFAFEIEEYLEYE